MNAGRAGLRDAGQRLLGDDGDWPTAAPDARAGPAAASSARQDSAQEVAWRDQSEVPARPSRRCAPLDVTPRTLRYYEYIELRSPEGGGAPRLQRPRARSARMTLIAAARRWRRRSRRSGSGCLIYDTPGRGADAQFLARPIGRLHDAPTAPANDTSSPTVDRPRGASNVDADPARPADVRRQLERDCVAARRCERAMLGQCATAAAAS